MIANAFKVKMLIFSDFEISFLDIFVNLGLELLISCTGGYFAVVI